MKKSMLRICSILILFFLLIHPAISLKGARNGLLLWADTVLPTLLPFMICSNIIVAAGGVDILVLPFKFITGKFLNLSGNGTYALITGLLCGYPMGAKNCSEFIIQKKISVSEGRYLLSICNHPSPMFLLGYVMPCLSEYTSAPALLLCVYFPILFIAPAALRLYHPVIDSISTNACSTGSHPGFDESLMSSFEIMVKIGGYIMLFSIFAEFINNIPYNFPEYKAFLLGLVEITTGIPAIASVFSGELRDLLLIMIIVFGGLSGIFQTKSVIKNAGLSLRHFIFWKAVHSMLSGICFIVVNFLAAYY